MEGFTCTRLLKDLEGKIDPRQYARKGHSTTDALLYMMQTIHEALDRGRSWCSYLLRRLLKRFSLLRRAGVDQNNLLKVYLCTVRPVLKYAVPIWQNIPDYLSKEIESVQKRALNIIFSESESYAEALNFAQLPTLSKRRVQICQKYMARMRRENHPLLPIPVVSDHDINLRQNTDRAGIRTK
jgi:hypothetical protein